MKKRIVFLLLAVLFGCRKDENGGLLSGTVWINVSLQDTTILAFGTSSFQKWSDSQLLCDVLEREDLYELNDGTLILGDDVYTFELNSDSLILSDDEGFDELWFRMEISPTSIVTCTEALAWSYFENSDYSSAHEYFSILTPSPESITGLGWTTLRMDSVPQSALYFQSISSDSIVDAYAGWSFSSWTIGSYSQAIAQSMFVLRKEPAFSFQHIPSIDYRDIIIVQAFSYFNLGDYVSAVQSIQVIEPTFNSTDPGTILAKLESLYVSHGG